jgi:hypothetical protein
VVGEGVWSDMRCTRGMCGVYCCGLSCGRYAIQHGMGHAEMGQTRTLCYEFPISKVNSYHRGGISRQHHSAHTVHSHSLTQPAIQLQQHITTRSHSLPPSLLVLLSLHHHQPIRHANGEGTSVREIWGNNTSSPSPWATQQLPILPNQTLST